MSRHRHHPPRPPHPRHPWRGLITDMVGLFSVTVTGSSTNEPITEEHLREAYRSLFRPANLPDEDDIFAPILLDKLIDPDWIAANWDNPTILGITDPPDDID